MKCFFSELLYFEIFLLLKIISPENFSIPKIDLAKDDFPDPDSPTKPSAEFFLIDKLIFLRAEK